MGIENIEHVVVVMMENRSFDNLLGWLYDPNNQPPFNQPPPANFEGVSGKSLSNPGPAGPVPVGRGNALTDPNPDPDGDRPPGRGGDLPLQLPPHLPARQRLVTVGPQPS